MTNPDPERVAENSEFALSSKENLDIITNADRTVTYDPPLVVNRKDAHRQGLWHRAIHIWVFRPSSTPSNGYPQVDVLLQLRSKHKMLYPLTWDASSTGHVSAGQTTRQAAVSEAFEELGLSLTEDDLVPASSFVVDMDPVEVDLGELGTELFWNREVVDMFVVRLDNDPELCPQETEVAALRWVPLQEFIEDGYGGYLEGGSTVLCPKFVEQLQGVVGTI
ncbi:NUDIX domain [Carpediemonas membranifera]|uniref:NUDIX domain n=1 Tax=Carpediemonas membranifera TaxID=201153 RepID=A0A8J6AYU4_9EUKA|nr:NUDIX domain [Carpediemonas membranifera]|eukprot:KAG9391773.1 NUDIX domain [Carpediemonas membranifera]